MSSSFHLGKETCITAPTKCRALSQTQEKGQMLTGNKRPEYVLNNGTWPQHRNRCLQTLSPHRELLGHSPGIPSSIHSFSSPANDPPPSLFPYLQSHLPRPPELGRSQHLKFRNMGTATDHAPSLQSLARLHPPKRHHHARRRRRLRRVWVQQGRL